MGRYKPGSLEDIRAAAIWQIGEEGYDYALVNQCDSLSKLDPEFKALVDAYEAAVEGVRAYCKRHEPTFDR